jgi:hypothetical protein
MGRGFSHNLDGFVKRIFDDTDDFLPCRRAPEQADAIRGGELIGGTLKHHRTDIGDAALISMTVSYRLYL